MFDCINELNLTTSDIQIKYLKDDIYYYVIKKLLRFNILFVKDYNEIDNSIETRFLKEDFIKKQLISFAFNKNIEIDESYNKAFIIILAIMKKINTRALLTTGNSLELCFFDLNYKVFLNKELDISNCKHIKNKLNN